jgi:hypothetical protein
MLNRQGYSGFIGSGLMKAIAGIAGPLTLVAPTMSSHADTKLDSVAIGVDAATPSALIQLTNKELQAKAETVVGRLRSLSERYVYNIASQALPGLDDRAKHDRKEASERELRELDEQFRGTLRSDAFNVDFELRRRLGPTAVAGIIGVAPSIVADDGTRISILQLYDAMHSIEQMASLLPSDR